jgi:hypothetical protein
VIEIRNTRLRKLKDNNRKLALSTKVLSIFYILIVTTSYLTSTTGAYLNDTANTQLSIESGNWEKKTEKLDNSSLDFLNKDKEQESNSIDKPNTENKDQQSKIDDNQVITPQPSTEAKTVETNLEIKGNEQINATVPPTTDSIPINTTKTNP